MVLEGFRDDEPATQPVVMTVSAFFDFLDAVVTATQDYERHVTSLWQKLMDC
jgi:ribosomal silencing factor RsfS